MVPNRLLFGDSFDRPGSTEVFSFRTSNLPASKAGGQGDCGRANNMDAYGKKAISLRRQPFIQPFLAPATPD
jgi:hypothetical protein